jgi:Flp pilus assembly protein TadG
MTGPWRRSRKAGRGQSLVEFSLTIPIFLLLIFGLFDLGRAVWGYTTLTNANKAAVRVAIVNQNTAGIQTRMISQGVALDLHNSNIDYIGYKNPFDAALGTSHPETAADCTDKDGNVTVQVGCIAVIKVHYDWFAVTPLIGNVVGPITLTSITEMPVEDAYTNP